MPARKVCYNFFKDALAPFHKYRQNTLIDATMALINGASLTLTSIGRFLPGQAQVKNKIKRVDRLLGNTALHNDIPAIFNNITAMITRQLPLCVIAVDWSGYPSQEYHVLRASLLCDGRAMPLLSWVVSSEKQNNTLIQNQFLDSLAKAVSSDARVIIVTDAGFKSPWFRHIASLGWDFIGRIRNNVQFHLADSPEIWLKISDCPGTITPKYTGAGTLAKEKKNRINGHFYTDKKLPKGRKSKRSKGRPMYTKTDNEYRQSAKEAWLIFSSIDDLKPREIIKLYSRRMQIEQNFRDEKSERFGFGLRASHSRSAGRMWELSLLATLSTIVLWLIGYHVENKGLHLRYQANSIKSRRVISYLTLAENVLRHSPLTLKPISLNDALNHLTRVYRNMVLVY
ncbi:IS4 family transposase [Photorhabdus laumondii subsp. laumondii]|uniref:IS4 family transposase n=1 Tax=Photorhabdus laumondii subsp. laumondii TaxID=141679 RepID=A0A6L9JEL8_PHOLM|nr:MULTISPECIES: IS4 family transposase [Photorhabdus]KTL62663.1 transposase [Photorhabdus laumondii subsp. laumondii]MCC8386051.1 IS4 family transposase [Photorhabdus laumondii]MCC8415225.1 IS4 family transposase [Photorhabdus laumondii]NDK92922.1 IS4 family transposase [Photorhabdus laumondii subsp. laumondii]NDL19061.1 IS4 family transposase [Photorhabdus laumondii subsp. laumondii]